MAERGPDAGAMTDAQLLARVWDWAGQAVAPIDADAIARGAATRVPFLSAIPLRASARGILSPAVSWPAFGFVLLLALLASLAVGALLVGSPQRYIPGQRLPTPFGPARNGVIVVSFGGDLTQFDPATGSTATLRSGASLDAPLFSPDGRQILFWELAGNRELRSLWVMNADGSGARQLLPFGTYGRPAWAPDGDRILVMDNSGSLNVVDVAKGTVVRHFLGAEFADPVDTFPVSWRPNHDQVLLSWVEGYLVNADGTGLRSLPASLPGEGGGWSGAWSPDGSTIAYSASTGRVDAQGRPVFRVHSLDVDRDIDRELTFDGSEGTGEQVGEFSPDGRRLLIFRNTGNYELSCNTVRLCWRSRPILVPVAGGGPEVVLGTFDAMSVPGEGGHAMFTPDGKQILGFYEKEPAGVWLYDADTGEEAVMTGPPGMHDMTWQRLAP